MVPPYPPVHIAKPFFASTRPSSRASAYSGSFSRGRELPNTLTIIAFFTFLCRLLWLLVLAGAFGGHRIKFLDHRQAQSVHRLRGLMIFPVFVVGHKGKRQSAPAGRIRESRHGPDVLPRSGLGRPSPGCGRIFQGRSEGPVTPRHWQRREKA